MTDYTDQQNVFDAIKAADNSQLWAIAGKVAKTAQKLNKTDNNSNELTKEYIASLNLDELLTDKSKLRTRVLASLIKGSDSGNHQASEKLAKLAGIESAVSDLNIEVINYANIIINCPECGANVHKIPLEDSDK